MSLLTSSRLRTARACQRLHHLAYGLGYRPVREEEALRFGTATHLGLNAWWRAWYKASEERLWLALEAVAGIEDAFERVRAEELLRGYHYRWEGEAYEVLGVELEFETELRNPSTGKPSRTWRLAGKLDLVVREVSTGRVLIGEHKTATGDIGPGSDYWKRLRLDGQVSVYYEGARSLGFDVSGCLYDVLGKPTQRPLLATPLEARKYTKEGNLYSNQRTEDETPEEYRTRVVEALASSPAYHYQRGEVVRLEEEMDEALWDVWALGQQLREAELAHRAPRNPDACTRWGRTCPFFSVCCGEASLEDPTLFTRSTTVHPELSSAKEARTHE